MGLYQLLLLDQAGRTKATLETFSFLDYVMAENDEGWFDLTLPDIYDSLLFENNDVIVDQRLVIGRSINGVSYQPEGDRQWLIRDGVRGLVEKGKYVTLLAGHDGNGLINRRIAAYDAGSAEVDKTNDPADNMMKAIMRENFGSLATDTARRITAYLTIQPDTTLGPNVSKAFSRRKLLPVLKEIAQTAEQNGTFIAFDVVAVGSVFEFRTYPFQRGDDHRQGHGSPIVLSETDGALTDVRRGYLHSDELTFVYAGGLGQEAARAIGTAQDTARLAASPLNRIEGFLDGRQTDNTAILADEAEAELFAHRPVRSFSASVNDTKQIKYGRDYKFGDSLTAIFRGEPIDCRVDRVHMTVADGVETGQPRLRVIA